MIYLVVVVVCSFVFLYRIYVIFVLFFLLTFVLLSLHINRKLLN
jgi:hypothetical protein